MRWSIVAQTWDDSTDQFEVRAATSRSFVQRLLTPSTAQLTINGLHQQAALIEELVTDIIIRCDNVDFLRLRCGNTQDSISETVHSVAYQFADYRAVLNRRLIDAFLMQAAQEQATTAINMINTEEAQTNGDYGIVAASGNATGQLKQQTQQIGDPVAKKIDELGRSSPSFDWDILPNFEFKVWYPQRGIVNGEILEWGKTVSSLTRTRTSGDYANAIIVTGGAGTVPEYRTSAGIATDPRGRWEKAYNFPDITIQATLAAHADELILESTRPDGSYNVVLKPGFWQGPSHIGMGDTVEFRLNSGRINEVLEMRVYEIGVNINDDGGEQVRLVLVMI